MILGIIILISMIIITGGLVILADHKEEIWETIRRNKNNG